MESNSLWHSYEIDKVPAKQRLDLNLERGYVIFFSEHSTIPVSVQKLTLLCAGGCRMSQRIRINKILTSLTNLIEWVLLCCWNIDSGGAFLPLFVSKFFWIISFYLILISGNSWTKGPVGSRKTRGHKVLHRYSCFYLHCWSCCSWYLEFLMYACWVANSYWHN